MIGVGEGRRSRGGLFASGTRLVEMKGFMVVVAVVVRLLEFRLFKLKNDDWDVSDNKRNVNKRGEAGALLRASHPLIHETWIGLPSHCES